MAKTYYVYILASGKRGTLYIGVTSDLVRRVHEHKTGAADGFTKRHGVKTLVWFETTTDVEPAIHREKQLKRWRRQWKFDLIEKNNADWLDLCESLL